MRLKNFIKKLKKKNTKQVVGNYSYSLLQYRSADETDKEIIWNGTNLSPPKYILSKNKKYKLFLDKEFVLQYTNYSPKQGERYLTYKTAEEYIKERQPILQLYWDNNYLECQQTYSSYEEYFAISCRGMNKNRLNLKTK